MSCEKLKIFVSSYACEPGKGSEIGVGWHWVLEMSKYFELWVMTRANNEEVIEAYFREHPEEKRDIHWVYYDCPNYIKRFKKQMRGVRTYYSLWQMLSNSLVKRTMEKNGIEIFHLLTYGNAIWTVSKYGQKKFFVWGPTGGVDTISQEYARHYAARDRATEFVRRIIVKCTKFSPGFIRRCKNANLIFCKAESTMQAIPPKYRHKAKIFTDVAMEYAPKDFSPIINPSEDALTYITVGRLDGWRGFDLLIEAFSRALQKAPKLTLKIIGEGSEKAHLRQLIAEKGLQDRIILIGQITMDEYRSEMKNCDAVINACLKEGGVTNAFDCMTWGKPFLCIDTGGYTRNFDSDCAIILKRGNREELIGHLCEGILQMRDFQLRTNLANAIVNRGKKITWEIKGQDIYKEIMEAWQKEHGGKE